MFGIIADFLASLTTILFPVFASYKALRTSDPAQLAPWLIYWVILSLILLVESWTVFIIGWLPFYSWIRLIALSYLVLPQTQGAKLLYTHHIEPFIANHERQIEDFIGDLHERGSKAGLGYLKQLINLIRQRLLGLPPTTESHPPPQPSASGIGYAQSLLSRFAMPSARAPSDFYSMLSGAVAAATASASASSPAATTTSSTTSTPIIPTNLATPTAKRTFLTTQRERLAILLKALDREQRDLDLAYGAAPPARDRTLEADVERRMRDPAMTMTPTTPTGSLEREQGAGLDDVGGIAMRKNRSDNSFQNIERDEVEGDGHGGRGWAGPEEEEEKKDKKQSAAKKRTTSGGGWIPTTWFSGGGGDGGAGGEAAAAGGVGEVAKEVRDAVQGMSSSIDTGR